MFSTSNTVSGDRTVLPIIKPDVITEPTWDREVLHDGYTIFFWSEKKLTVFLNNCETYPLKVSILNTSSGENISYSVFFESHDRSYTGDKFDLYSHQIDLSEFAESGTIFKVLQNHGESSAHILFHEIFGARYSSMAVVKGNITEEGRRQLNSMTNKKILI